MRRLKRRAEFLAVARGVRSVRRGFVLQALPLEDPSAEPRCGFTVSKKVGNAVVRNRVRRRLKEAVRLDAEALGRPGFDHVLIGRREALRLSFEDLRADLAGAFRQARKTAGRDGRARDGAPSDSRARDVVPSDSRARDVVPSDDASDGASRRADASAPRTPTKSRPDPRGETPGRTR